MIGLNDRGETEQAGNMPPLANMRFELVKCLAEIGRYRSDRWSAR